MNANKIMNDIMQQVSSDFVGLFNEVVTKTPIKTGAARTSHKLNDVPFNRNETNYKTYTSQEIIPFILNDKLALISNCPYIGKLESGFSNQAPFGFYNIALLNFKNKIKNGV